MLLRTGSTLSLAARLRDGTLTLGEAFSFMSGLYFRGKLTYATTFGRSPAALPSAFVITTSRGLQPPDIPVTAQVIREFASVDVSAGNARYRLPLERDIVALGRALGPDARVILLGSLATGKYVDLLLDRLGGRLYYPPSFVGRGDMSRGGLLLRRAASRQELEYAVLDAASRRHGPRPPKLDPPGIRRD
jgi:hypothetical protein